MERHRQASGIPAKAGKSSSSPKALSAEKPGGVAGQASKDAAGAYDHFRKRRDDGETGAPPGVDPSNAGPETS